MTATFLQPIEQACRDFLLCHKWLLAPSRRIAIQWKDQVTLGGTNIVNLHPHTLGSVVLDLLSGELAERGFEFASEMHCSLIAGKVLSESLEAGKLSYLQQVESKEKLAQLIARTVGDLRLANLNSENLDSAMVEEPKKAFDLQILTDAFEEELQRQKLVDYSACLKLAIELFDSAKIALPDSLIAICPVDLSDSRLETDFLERLANHCEFIGPPPPTDDVKFHAKFVPHFHRTIGEVNEVQLILQNAFDRLPESSLDQIEILHTDYATYVPLVHETLVALLDESNNSIDNLPVSFGEGLACIYSRPGRALRSWLRWIRNDFLQTQIVLMIREGLVRFEDDEAAIGFSQLAHNLRKLPVGFGGSRYEARINDAIGTAKLNLEAEAKRQEDSDHEYVSTGYDFGLAAFEKLRATIVSLIDESPNPKDEPLKILASAKQFLNKFARRLNKLDEYAKEKLLNDISGMEQAVAMAPETLINVWDWLEQLPVESRILASGPRPGCIHVDHIAKGGHSGRTKTYIVGLDDSRFPYRGGQDPLLLDFERHSLSEDLRTSGDINFRSQLEYRQLLNRMSGDVHFSYATYSLAGDHEQFPSSLLLETFRELTDQPTASLENFEFQVGPPATFCPINEQLFVTSDQWWQATLAAEDDIAKTRSLLETDFQHFGQSRFASEQRSNDEFTQYDGLVPAAGKQLDPTNPDSSRVSPSRLETYGVCPRKFFFRYGLGITPPDEHVVETDKWLNPLALGSLLHEVFEDFLRDISTQNRIPELEKDFADLQNLLHSKINELKQIIPVPNEDAFQRQVQQLEKTCEIFLRHEEEHCRSTGAIPWVFEASIGLGGSPVSDVDCEQPVSITLSDGRVLKVGGRIDRVDRIGDPDSLNFAIWDYKTGSAWGFDQADPIKQGRKLQPYLYAGMLKHRLVATVGANAKVNYFGYFFPSPRTEGLRLQWTSAELRSGDEVLRHICDAIGKGSFIATNNKDDCGYCDYLPICGEPYQTAASSLVQLSTCPNPVLEPMRQLRGVELVEMEDLQ